MSQIVVVGIIVLYLLVLFGIAYLVDQGSERLRRWSGHPFIYALSLGVFCTAWTFYGSVGRAASAGPAFLTTYLGPAILAPVWIIVFRKLILVSKQQRITSVPDFIASRYGRSVLLSVIASIMVVIGVIPYISIQIRAITDSVQLLSQSNTINPALNADPTLLITAILALFAILFGTRHLDPNERHEGLIAVVAFESVFKLIAFLAVGIFVTFVLFNGPADLFAKAAANVHTAPILDLEEISINGWEWFWLSFVSMLAFILLPRQFHVAVVENDKPGQLQTASWLLPLYLLLINIFVIPIAIGGLLLLGEGHNADTFVLSLPLAFDREGLALLVALGGFAAASGMVIVSSIALSITLSNNLFVPLVVNAELLQSKGTPALPRRLIGIRRLSIAVIILLAFAYYRIIGETYSLVSIGLISFLAVAQFAPALVGGLYWRLGNKKGALAGLITGFVIWAFTLPLPTLIEAGLLSGDVMEEGFLGLASLRPYSLFGTEGMSQFSHAAFWSLGLNTLVYITVSLFTRNNPAEVAQADLFTNIESYQELLQPYDFLKRRVLLTDLSSVLERFLGKPIQESIWKKYSPQLSDPKMEDLASQELVSYAENQLTGSLGSASARIIMHSITTSEPVNFDEVLQVLEQTQEIVRYSEALERKSTELETSTRKLQKANAKLKELDKLKAEFITTVTHELRTPITSIKAFSKILQDNPNLEPEKKQSFTAILVSESERISRLINQVLDLEKIQEQEGDYEKEELDFSVLVKAVGTSLSALMQEKNIDCQVEITASNILVWGNADLLMQAITNIWGNAVKFCPSVAGKILVQLTENDKQLSLKISDNGPGVPKEMQSYIFDRFTQLTSEDGYKPTGSGLGLNITQHIIEQHSGRVFLHEEALLEGASFVTYLPVYHPFR